MIIRNSDNLVILDGDWNLTADYAIKGRTIHRRLNTSNATYKSGDLPEGYLYGQTTYSGGVFARVESAANVENLRAIKIEELKAETTRRTALVNEEINTWGMLMFLRMIWLSIAPAARDANADLQAIIDIVTPGKAAHDTLKGYTTVAQLEAFDPVTTPAWP